MSKLPRKRPSAGVIIGMLALVMAIAGTAIAGSATQGKITKDKVKTIIENVAPSLHVSSANTANTANTADRAKTADSADTANSAKTADSADTAKTADKAKIATNVFSAMVLADGTMLGSIPAGATSSRLAGGSSGHYFVSFPRDITGCTISASLGTNSVLVPSGEIDIGVKDSTRLAVATADSTGASADRAFYVQAVCPG